MEAIATGSGAPKALVEGIAQREEALARLTERISEARTLLQPRLAPRSLALRDYVTGEASVFQGDLAKDKHFLTHVLDGIYIFADGAIVLRFKDDALFAPVAAYEVRTTSEAPTGSRGQRRREHLWETSLARRAAGPHAKLVVKELRGARPIIRPADRNSGAKAPPSVKAGSSLNSFGVPSGI